MTFALAFQEFLVHLQAMVENVKKFTLTSLEQVVSWLSPFLPHPSTFLLLAVSIFAFNISLGKHLQILFSYTGCLLGCTF